MKVLFLGGPAHCEIKEVPDDWETVKVVMPSHDGYLLHGTDKINLDTLGWVTEYTRKTFDIPIKSTVLQGSGTSAHQYRIIHAMYADNFTMDKEGANQLANYIAMQLLGDLGLSDRCMVPTDEEFELEEAAYSPPQQAPIPIKKKPTR